MTIGEQIYRLRTARSMSQEDLADRLDVSRQSISKWETNAATPELEKLIRLCLRGGCSCVGVYSTFAYGEVGRICGTAAYSRYLQ